MHNHPGFWITDFAKFRVSILEGGGGGGCSCCVVVLSCGCCPSSAFSSSFCRSRLYPLPLKHVAASTAACFNFSFADGCFNVWSPLSPICPCAIQLTSAERQCMTLRSLVPCLRAAREKHRFAAEKKTSEWKKHVWQQEKNALQREKVVPQREKRQQKMPLRSGKNSKQQKKHLAAAQKHLCSRKNAFWRQREKTVRSKKKTGRGRKKKTATEKVQLCNPKSCRNGKNTFPQREKAAAHPTSFTRM